MMALILSQHVTMEKLRGFGERALLGDWLFLEVCDGLNKLSFSLAENNSFKCKEWKRED